MDLVPPPSFGFYSQKPSLESCGCAVITTEGIHFLNLQVLLLPFSWFFITSLFNFTFFLQTWGILYVCRKIWLDCFTAEINGFRYLQLCLSWLLVYRGETWRVDLVIAPPHHWTLHASRPHHSPWSLTSLTVVSPEALWAWRRAGVTPGAHHSWA